MKLKTLKDLEKNDRLNPNWEWISKFELRAEMIKWVKDLSKTSHIKGYENDEVIRWIKHFFDITEEDLK